MHPRRLLGTRFSVHSCSAFVLASILIGCGTAPIPGTDSTSRSRSDSASGELPPVESPVIEAEINNDAFADAQPATLPITGEIVIEGTIGWREDVDLYALGPALAGDRIIIDVHGHDGLNTVAAMFNGGQDLIDANDDRSYYGGLVDPYISRVIRADTSNLYLGIAVSSVAHFGCEAGRFDTGSYSIIVRRKPDEALRKAQRQIVYLDFEGGSHVQIGLEPIEIMRPFSAESISDRLKGQTDYIVGLVVEHVQRDFAAYNVTLLDSKNHAKPTEPHSTLFFGNYSATYLGLADSVDTGNASLAQEAIIYAEDLALFESLVPSAEEVALALANIASHELGHLLGLEHAALAGDLMATAASARQILEIDAEFRRTLLQSDVFPVGCQDGPGLLVQNVGPNPNGSSARVRLEDLLPRPSGSWRDEAGVPDIPITQYKCNCGACGHHDHH